MFWGYVLKGRKLTSILRPEEPIRIVSVALNQKDDLADVQVKVFARQDNREYLICTLNQDNAVQQVDIMFDGEDDLCFRVSGYGEVHLVGNIEPREVDDGSSVASSRQGSDDSFRGLNKNSRSRLDQFAKQRPRAGVKK
ncbi:hypothetical protein HDE_05332 [Halotydeus destructor]|nr:hypothetical protein HDE_05332 [Halotydeus destructor]